MSTSHPLVLQWNAALIQIARPPQIPGQQLAWRLPLPPASSCTNTTPMTTRWDAWGNYTDLATYGYQEAAPGQWIRAGYALWLHGTIYLCEWLMSEECAARLGTVACFYSKYPRRSATDAREASAAVHTNAVAVAVGPPAAAEMVPVTPLTPLQSDIEYNVQIGPEGGKLELSDPIVILGKGHYGRVVQGTYGGVRVAVKLVNTGLLDGAVVVTPAVVEERQVEPAEAETRKPPEAPRAAAAAAMTPSTGGMMTGSTFDTQVHYLEAEEAEEAGVTEQQAQLRAVEEGVAEDGEEEGEVARAVAEPPAEAVEAEVKEAEVKETTGPPGARGLLSGLKVVDLERLLVVTGGPAVMSTSQVAGGGGVGGGGEEESHAGAAQQGDVEVQQHQRQQQPEYGTAAAAIVQEVEVLARCRHPNIVQLLAASVSTDLKPANVLISQPDSDRPIAKLADFGLSRLLQTVLVTQNPEAGTTPYMAPELFDITNFFVTDRVDMYGFGVLLWEMLAGERPWLGLTQMQVPAGRLREYVMWMVAIAVAVAVHSSRPPLHKLSDERCPLKIRTLIWNCWNSDPARRPAAAEAYKTLALVQETLEKS
ncbi:hypothetical protein VOLCADRAFT_100452 [Volvox carteri f. nagariensis]|uniref:Protein kinase domain-containing protein n=1 Tax=Volvox carteri f. nagariensis TaxID=3068 RepID=D8UK88_VOLCA|nr:uncharacterized protein VOLCADRAFT_100452 [Volvox carteri f. nagariensis]EFJ39871.1 hypothetical protein VOLCADRAFT_100452 [Volvox carteri f. nagariensis]|eukprot:XP_002959077.1 hypothetical protein VOLCADRAFT_100452 [Volvox carteri f. nagariensis]